MTLTYHVTVNVDARAFTFVVAGQSPSVALAKLLKDQARAKLRVLSRSATPAEIAEALCPDNRYSSAQAALRNYLIWRTMLAEGAGGAFFQSCFDDFQRCNIPGATWSAGTVSSQNASTAALAGTQLFLS